MTALNRLDLDLLQARGCTLPNCKHAHGGPIYFHSACHVERPTWVRYEDGVLTVICAECRKVIARVEVAKAPVAEENL